MGQRCPELACPLSSFSMPSIFPEGRVGTARFCAIAGLGRTVFLTRYRHDPTFIRRFDIRIDALGRLSMSEAAAIQYGQQRAGKPAHGNSGRFRGRPCPDPTCDAHVPNRADTCRKCSFPMRWRCSACGTKSGHTSTVCTTCQAPGSER